MKTPQQAALLRMMGTHIVTQARLLAVEELAVKAAGHLPESMLGNMSPELFLEKKRQSFLDELRPYFSDEVRDAIDEELKEFDGLDSRIELFRRWLRRQEEE